MESKVLSAVKIHGSHGH